MLIEALLVIAPVTAIAVLFPTSALSTDTSYSGDYQDVMENQGENNQDTNESGNTENGNSNSSGNNEDQNSGNGNTQQEENSNNTPTDPIYASLILYEDDDYKLVGNVVEEDSYDTSVDVIFNTTSIDSIIIDNTYEVDEETYTVKSVNISTIENSNTQTGVSISTLQLDNCTDLETFVINDDGIVSSIDKLTFQNCSNLTNVSIPSGVITTISQNAFYGCTSLETITIPDTVTSIGTYAFYECTSLETITIPDTVTSIGTYAFYGCSSLVSITIPEGITQISQYCFYNCTSLASVQLPNSMNLISLSAFENCSSLTSIVIPPYTNSMGNRAFYGIDNLDVTLPAHFVLNKAISRVFDGSNNTYTETYDYLEQ